MVKRSTRVEWLLVCVLFRVQPILLSVRMFTLTIALAAASEAPGPLPPTGDRPPAEIRPFLSGSKIDKGSLVDGPKAADSGTSAACPVAAGVVAALRTRRPASALPPSSLADLLRSTARHPGGPATRDNDYGSVIIDPYAVAQAMGLIRAGPPTQPVNPPWGRTP